MLCGGRCVALCGVGCSRAGRWYSVHPVMGLGSWWWCWKVAGLVVWGFPRCRYVCVALVVLGVVVWVVWWCVATRSLSRLSLTMMRRMWACVSRVYLGMSCMLRWL